MGGSDTPAFKKSTSNLDSLLLKASTEALMVLRSSSSRITYSSWPADEASLTEDLISEMACCPLASDRAVMWTLPPALNRMAPRWQPTPEVPPVTMKTLPF